MLNLVFAKDSLCLITTNYNIIIVYMTSGSSSLIVLPGRSYLNYINSIKLPLTRSLYVIVLKKFMEFCHIKATEELLNGLGDSQQIESRIIDFIVSSRDTAYYCYSNLKLAAIMDFYSINDLQLNRRKLGKFLGEEVRKQKDRQYTLAEIQKMLHMADERGKAVVMLLASTGMTIGALGRLNGRIPDDQEQIQASDIIFHRTSELRELLFKMG